MVWAAFLVYGSLAAFSYAILLYRHGLDLFTPAPGWFTYSILAAGAGLAVVGASMFCAGRFAWAQEMESEFLDVLGPLTGREVLFLATSSAIAEEAFFRGVLVPWQGVVASSIVFGLVHFPLSRKLLPWPVFATLIGLLLGDLYLRSGSLIPPMVTHFVVNGINLFLLSARARELGIPRRDIWPDHGDDA
jgi:membrane protease YdiL (CAAX protease family)